MRFSLRSGAVLLVSEFLVSGRPLSTEQEAGASAMPLSPIPTPALDSSFTSPDILGLATSSSPSPLDAFPENIFTEDGTQPDSNLKTGLFTSPAPQANLFGTSSVGPDTFFKTALLSSPELQQAPQSDTPDGLDMSGKEPSGQSLLGNPSVHNQANANSENSLNPFPTPLLLSESETAPPLPENIYSVLWQMKKGDLTFCIYELSADEKSLQAEGCHEKPGGLFDTMDKYGPGLTIYSAYVRNRITIFFIMDLHHSCQRRVQDGDGFSWYDEDDTDATCSTEDIRQKMGKFTKGLLDAWGTIFPDEIHSHFVAVQELKELGVEFQIKDFIDSRF